MAGAARLPSRPAWHLALLALMITTSPAAAAAAASSDLPFVPGTGCGTTNAVKTIASLPDGGPGEVDECSYVEDAASWKAYADSLPRLRYGEWSPCSASCDGGTKTRSRECTDRRGEEVLDMGRCPGGDDREQTWQCNMHECLPEWSDWGEYGECSYACAGPGQMTRSRDCLSAQDGSVVDPTLCGADGQDTQTESCQSDCCDLSTEASDTTAAGAVQDWHNHQLDCPEGTAMKAFRMVNVSPTSIRFDFTCCSVTCTDEAQQTSSFATYLSTTENNLDLLDSNAHVLKCWNLKLVSRWWLRQLSTGDIQFFYDCCDTAASRSCSAFATDRVQTAPLWDAADFAGTAVACPDGKFLSEFAIKTDDETEGGDEHWVEGMCCNL